MTPKEQYFQGWNIVKTKNGTFRILCADANMFSKKEKMISINLTDEGGAGKHLYMHNYNDDMEWVFDDCFSIETVYSFDYIGDLFKALMSGDTITEKLLLSKGAEIVWTRAEDCKEMTVDEISKALGYKVKVVGDDQR